MSCMGVLACESLSESLFLHRDQADAHKNGDGNTPEPANNRPIRSSDPRNGPSLIGPLRVWLLLWDVLATDGDWRGKFITLIPMSVRVWVSEIERHCLIQSLLGSTDSGQTQEAEGGV